MTTAPVQTCMWAQMRERIDSQYRADLAALARLRQITEEKTQPHNPSAFGGATQFGILSQIMEASPTKRWSVAELASASGLPQNSIRTVLYTRPQEFQRHEDVRPFGWQLKKYATPQ